MGREIVVFLGQNWSEECRYFKQKSQPLCCFFGVFLLVWVLVGEWVILKIIVVFFFVGKSYNGGNLDINVM